jgi:hypothetical protein
MLNISRTSFVCVILASTLGTVAAFGTQKASEAVPPAPVPAQIPTGKKFFISYAGVNAYVLYSMIADNTGSPNGLYDEFYAGVKSWAGYELVSVPDNADLIFEICLNYGPEGGGVPHFGLKILDAKTHILVWALVENVPSAGRSGNRHKNWQQAMGKFLDDARQVTGQSVATANEPKR